MVKLKIENFYLSLVFVKIDLKILIADVLDRKKGFPD